MDKAIHVHYFRITCKCILRSINSIFNVKDDAHYPVDKTH